MRHRPTSRILLNKWQCQQEKDHQRWLDERCREEERREKEQDESHWSCPFFSHCWNEGLKLPTQNNCPECSEQYLEYRQSRTNRQSMYERLDHPQDIDWRIKKESIHDQLGKRVLDQNLVMKNLLLSWYFKQKVQFSIN